MCFTDDKDVIMQVENWRKFLKSFCHKAFKKIRIRNNKIKPINHSISMVIDERNLLTQKDETKNKVKINYINNSIAELEAEENRNKIFKNFSSFSENPDSVNMQQMWKLLKKLWPKTNPTLPTAKRNHRGKIVSGPTS